MTVALARDGQNEPTANLSMAGFRHTNVGQAASVEDYLRTNQFITDVPIFVVDEGAGGTHISASVDFYTTVSAAQAPPDGAKLRVYKATGAARSMRLVTPTGTHSADIKTQAGETPHNDHIKETAIHDFVYHSASAAWKLLNAYRGTQTLTGIWKGKNAATSVTGVAGGSTTNYMNVDGGVVTIGTGSEASVSVSASTRYFVFSASLPPGTSVGAANTESQIFLSRVSGATAMNCTIAIRTNSSIEILDARFGGGVQIFSADEMFHIPAFGAVFLRT